ncbi:MAG: DinB family protein [Cyclobacteriaceae bacterium]|nr:DinB family protein [Cyclobacteriaceae bacterium]
MNKTLANQFESLEAQRKELLSSLGSLPADKLNNHSEGHWSINQIIAHLIAAEKLSVAYLQKKILAINEVDNTGIYEEIKMIGLIISQRLPLKFRAPRVVVENTNQTTDISQLEKEWAFAREELRQLLEKVADDQIKRRIYKHVRAGKLNILHALIFFREHIIHHQPQIKRLM